MALDMTMTMKATTPTDDGDGTRHGTRNPATRGIVASYVAFVGVSRFVCVCVLWGGGSGSAAGPCSVRGKYLHNKKGGLIHLFLTTRAEVLLNDK